MRYVRIILISLLAAMMLIGATTALAEGDSGGTVADSTVDGIEADGAESASAADSEDGEEDGEPGADGNESREVLSITSKYMPAVYLGETYDEKIPFSGAELEDCIFELVSGNLPTGMVLTIDGRITTDENTAGYAKAGGSMVNGGGSVLEAISPQVYVRLTDTKTDRVAGRWMMITVKYNTVDLTISNQNQIWQPTPDGEELNQYCVDITASTDEVSVSDDLLVTYTKNDQNGENVPVVTDAGIYFVHIEPAQSLYAKHYTIGSVNGVRYMNIGRNSSNTIAFLQDSYTVNYDEDYDLKDQVMITPEEISNDWEFSYTGTGNTIYNSAEKPQNAGTYLVKATANNNNYSLKYDTAALTIKPLAVNVAVSRTEQDYVIGADSYYPEVNALLNKDGTVFNDYEITYINLADSSGKTLTKVENAGEYTYSIKTLNSNYTLNGDLSGNFKVNPVVVDFSATQLTHKYDGSAHSAVVTAGGLTEGVDFKVTYDGMDSVPVEVGTYTVDVVMLNPNYIKGELDNNQLVITVGTMNFTSGSSSAIYNAKDQTPVLVPSISGFTGFEVSWMKDWQPVEQLKDAGKYTVTVKLTDNNFDLGTLPFESFVIEKAAVDFAISSTEQRFDSGVAEYEATVEAKNLPEGVEFVKGTDFAVEYYAAEGEEAVSKVTEPGKYTIKIILLNDGNYKIGEISGEKVLKITAQDAAVILSDGNSLYHKLADEVAREQFAQDRLYKGVYYSDKAWGSGEDADLSRTAYFVVGKAAMYGFDAANLGYAAVDEFGNAIENESVTITIDGVPVEDWQISAGVHKMKYSVVGKEVSAERTLVVLNDMGDVNGDGYINVGDARYLKQKIVPEIAKMQTIDELLHLYRVCDVEQDGNVTEADYAAILNRMNKWLHGYYEEL